MNRQATSRVPRTAKTAALISRVVALSALLAICSTAQVVITPGQTTLHASDTTTFAVFMAGRQLLLYHSWTLSPLIGSIEPNGTYHAPASISSIQKVTVAVVLAPSNVQLGSAEITLLPSISVSIAPNAIALRSKQTYQFLAVVNNSAAEHACPWWSVCKPVTWSLSPKIGAISDTGLYSAPPQIDTPMTVTITATSTEDPRRFATSTISLRPPVTVSIEPSIVILKAGEATQFSAKVQNASNLAVTSTRSPTLGTISTNGLFASPTAVNSSQTVTITATSVDDPTKTANAIVTIVPRPPVTISVDPATMLLKATKQFSAAVQNASNPAVVWTRTPGVGTVSDKGLFAAPPEMSAAQTVKVTATSVEDPGKSATATVTISAATNPVTIESVTPPNCKVTVPRLADLGFAACTIKVTGTGPWTIEHDGRYYPEARACIWKDNACAGTAASGSAVVRVYSEMDNNAINADTYNRAVIIAGVTIPVTITVLPNVAPPVYFNAKRVPDSLLGCTAQDPTLQTVPYFNLCNIPNMRPGGTFTIPPPGQTFRDEVFGTELHVITADHHDYSAIRIWSADSKYVLINNTSDHGTNGIFEVETGRRVSPAPPQFGPSHHCQFGPVLGTYDIYCFNDNTIVKWTLSSDRTKLDGPATVWTAPVPGAIDDGGRRSVPGWLSCRICTEAGCMEPSQNSTACYMIYVVNLQTGQFAQFDLTSVVAPDIMLRNVRLLPKDEVTGKHYVNVGDVAYLYSKSTAYGARWLQFDSSTNTLTYYGIGPTRSIRGVALDDCAASGAYCYTTGHATDGLAGGRSFMAVQSVRSGVNAVGLVFPGIDPIRMGDYREVGGGVTHLVGVMDHHTAAATLPLIASAYEFDDISAPAAMHIQAIAGSPAVLTLDDHDGSGITNIGVTSGDRVLIGCETDNPGTQEIQGTYHVGAVLENGSKVLLSDLMYSGTYSGSCAITKDASIAGIGQKTELVVARLDDLGFPMQVVRLSKLRAVGYSSGMEAGSTGYWGQAHAQLSPDGRWAGYTTNGGEPNRLRFIVAPVPWQLRTDKAFELAPGFPVNIDIAGTTASIRARVPDPADLKCSVSVTQDLGSPVMVSLPGPSTDRLATFAAQPNTQYYWRCSTPAGWFVAQGRFKTQ